MDREDFFTGLNDRQKEAVACLEGPLLILAGAGSGKTRILTHRIAWLIENGVAPWHILAITFTNKAAGEMRERTDRILGESYASEVFVSTFHSMCVRLLRRDIDRLGYERDFTIYDADDQKTLIRSCIKTLNLDNKIYRDRAVQNIISNQKNEMVGAKEYEDAASDFYERGVAKIYGEYERQLMANNALDFDDLLIKTVELFRNYPEVLEYWQNRFRYIMVDEYQDTNNVQFELVRLLAEKYGNLCVVGDDDQSIYKFRGANIANILNFERTFPGAKTIKLEQNYRSTKRILNAANEVIKNNKGRKEKKLWTENEEGSLPVFQEYETAAQEADRTIRKAAEALRKGIPLREQAILYRTNAQSRLLEEKCVAGNLPYVIVGGVNFYQRKEIKDILSYLRVIANGTDDLACRRIINVPKRGIGQTSIDRIGAFASAEGISFYDALLRCGEIPQLGSAVKKVRGFTDMIGGFREEQKSGGCSIRSLIEEVRDDSGYAEELMKEDPVSGQTRLENIEELINKAVSFEEEHEAGQTPEEDALSPQELLSLFLEEISLVSDIDRTNNSDDVLTMMTLHAAKGLEFDVIYLCGMEEGLFPSSASINAEDPEAEIEEERRLCYVGFTRARKELNLSAARERMVNGETRFMKPSRFIDEIPEDAAEKHFVREHQSYENRRQSFAGFGGYEGRMNYEADHGASGSGFGDSAYRAYNAFNDRGFGSGSSGGAYADGGFGTQSIRKFGSLDTTPAGRPKKRGAASLGSVPGLSKGFGNGGAVKQKPDYKTGDRVSHIKFGTGTVADIVEDVKDYKVTVDFDESGRKVMYAGFAKLKRI